MAIKDFLLNLTAARLENSNIVFLTRSWPMALYELFEQEIFSQYTPPEQDLLVKLSILDCFPRGLVQAVTGEPQRPLGSLLPAYC